METISLVRRYPGLLDVPRVPIAMRPTPVDRSMQLESDLGVGDLRIKREDVSGSPYGGNKIRKLEFLLGKAKAEGHTATITFGAAGSNHALATAVYSSREGLEHHSLLSPQPNARYVRKNLLHHAAQGVDILHGESFEGHERTVEELTEMIEARDGVAPLVVPIGGSSPLGTFGPVDAALEFADQVASGSAPEPDFVYVPLGSLGTVAGVAIGLAAAGLKSKVVAVRVTPIEWANPESLGNLVNDTVDLLRSFDSSFPELRYEDLGVEIRDEFYGEGYARFTSAGMEGIAIARAAGYGLEGTYSGKAFSALVADARAGRLADSNAVFWLTYNSQDVSEAIEGATAERLPGPLQRYFSEPVQELDYDEAERDEGEDVL